MGGQSFVTSYLGGLPFCDVVWRGGVKNRPKLRDVIYGRPLIGFYN